MPDPATPEAPAPEAAPETPKAPESPEVEKDWKAEFEAQQRINRDLEKKVKGDAAPLKAELEELRALKAKAEGREAEHAAEMAKREAEREALGKANERILKAEVRAAAAAKLADPADALRFIDLSSLEVGDDGEVDSAAIASAIDDLLTKKPYLAVQDGKRFKGSADGGTRKESQPAQLTEADVKRLYAEKNYAEIEKARTEGRLNDVLGVTS